MRNEQDGVVDLDCMEELLVELVGSLFAVRQNLRVVGANRASNPLNSLSATVIFCAAARKPASAPSRSCWFALGDPLNTSRRSSSRRRSAMYFLRAPILATRLFMYTALG